MAKKQNTKVSKELRNKFSIRDERGRFVKIHPVLERNLNITELIEREGMNNRFELFEKYPKMFGAFREVVLHADLPIKANHEKIISDIESFKHDIFINNKKVSKLEALDAVLKTNDTIFGLMKGQGLKFLTYKKHFKKHLTELHINTPDQSVLDKIEKKFRPILKTKDKEERDRLLDQLNDDLAEFDLTVWYYEPSAPEEEIIPDVLPIEEQSPEQPIKKLRDSKGRYTTKRKLAAAKMPRDPFTGRFTTERKNAAILKKIAKNLNKFNENE